MSTVITLIPHSDKLTNEQVELHSFFDKFNIIVSQVEEVSDHVVDFYTNDDVSILKVDIRNFAAKYKCDLIIQPTKNRQKKLAVFDMDSTLIMNECIDLMAAKAGVEQEVAAITEQAMRGNLDFSESLAKRVSLLKGIPVSIYKEVIEKITLTNGTKELCANLKRNNVKLAVLSGGFQPIVDWIKDYLHLDYAFANNLVDDGKTLAGFTAGRIVDGKMKAQLLREIAEKEGLSPEDAVAVGDGSNDLLMMAEAGFGIAWHAKPKVRLQAPSQLNSKSLNDVLYILGYQ